MVCGSRHHDGVERSGLDIRRRVGYVAERPTLYEWMTIDEIGWFAAGFYPPGFQRVYAQYVERFELDGRKVIKTLSKGMRAKVALSLARSEHATFHGFALAQAMREHGSSRSLTAHGTLYKALGRLEEFGLLTSHWEDAAAAEGRPRRRLYELTQKGADVAAQARTAEPAPRRAPRIASRPA